MEHPQTHTQRRVQRVTIKTTYGLYQYRIISIHIWIISIQDYTNNERVKTSTIYHISVPEKIPPLQYYHPRQKV